MLFHIPYYFFLYSFALPRCGGTGNPSPGADAGGVPRGVVGAAPYGGKVPNLSLRASAHTGVAIRVPRPFSNVFKWQFENSAIFNFQFSIFNLSMWGTGDEQCSPLQAGAWRTLCAATPPSLPGRPPAGGSACQFPCRCPGAYRRKRRRRWCSERRRHP